MPVSNLTKMVESSLDRVENTVEKGDVALSVRAISSFPTEFSKDLHCIQVKTRAYCEKG